MTRYIAVFGEMGLKYGHLIDAALTDLNDWQVDVWPCDCDLAARDAMLETCEVAVMAPDFILTPGNFGALMAAPNLKLVAQPWVGTDWLDPGFLPKGLMVCNAGGHAASMAEHVMASVLEHAIDLRAQHADMLAQKIGECAVDGPSCVLAVQLAPEQHVCSGNGACCFEGGDSTKRAGK